MGALCVDNLALLLAIISGVSCGNEQPYQFPDGFRFGVSTAAYQIEGGWKSGGKGESIWDEFTHHHPNKIASNNTGDIADDSYDQHKRDVEMLSYLGVDYYRFSISWPRVLPTGFIDKPNKAGIDYYHKLIDELLDKGIEPLVTMYHWDLPEPLQDIGGWPNAKLADYFEDYADFLYKTFGDKVKSWITFNEPKQICQFGYGVGVLAPGVKSPGVGDYLCAHTILLSHARAYKIYNEKYRRKQKGKVGISIDMDWIKPATNSKADNVTAEVARQFQSGIYGHPIFSKEGDYPPLVKKIVAAYSKAQGLTQSRLPAFTQQQIKDLRGSADFFGLNHYTALLASRTTDCNKKYYKISADLVAKMYPDPSWPSSKVSPWFKIYPLGIRKVLNWLRKEYGNIEIMITENGFPTDVGLNDQDRINYLRDNMKNVIDAIDDGVNVTAYTIWSLEDNFEWTGGYKQRFGIFETDYNSPERKRTARHSARYYKNVILTGLLEPTKKDIECQIYCLNNEFQSYSIVVKT